MATNPPSQPTDGADRSEWRVSLTEAFWHPRFGVVLWHDYPDHAGETFVMSARLKDERRAQAFVDDYKEQVALGAKPTYSAN